jgi:hypothetical protein
MKDLLRAVVPLAALLLGCATPRPPEVKERAAGHAAPEPNKGCANNVQRALLATNLEQVSVRVTLLDRGAVRLSLLAPELTAAQAEEMRRAFSTCRWLPGPNGEPTGTITFGRAP